MTASAPTAQTAKFGLDARRLTRSCAVLLLGLFALSAPLLHSSQVQAQDWDVKRNPFDRSLINRYKGILRRRPNDKGALGKLTRMYRRYSSIEKLVAEFNKELIAKPNSFELHVILGHLEQGQGKQAESLTFFEKAAALKPSDPGVQIALGDMFAKSAMNDKAKAAYEKALPLVNDKASKIKIRRALADIALTAGNIDVAIGHYKEYFKLDPKNVQAQIDLGDALANHKRYKDAIEAFRTAEKRLGTDPTLRVQVVARIGQVHESAGKPDAAVREYKRAIGMVSRGYYLTRELTERIIGIYRERQQLAELVASFEKDWAPGKRGHFEWDVVARLYEETGNQDKALIAYRAATKKSPYELDTQRRLINLLETSGRDQEALRQYEAVIRVAPGEPRFQLELAQRYWRTGQQKKALALLKKIESRFAQKPGVFSTIAELYSEWGKEDLALAAYQKLAKIEPDEAKHLVNLGEQYYQRNQKAKALTIWKRIIRKKDAASYARLARVYADHDLGTEALEAYSKAIALDAKTARHYQGRAGVFERRRLWIAAIADWERVLKLTPDREANRPARREARRRIVNLLHRSSRRTLANRVQTWKTQFSATPPDIGAGYFLVEAHLRLGENGNAKKTLERLLKHNPKDTDAMTELVKVYRDGRDYDKAVALLKRLLAGQPNRAREYYTKIAEIMTAQRKDDEAIFYSQKALEKSPNDPTAHLELARRYVEMTKYDLAIAEYELTLKFDPRNTHASFALASLYGFKNLRDKEAKLYNDVLRRASDDDILLRAGRAAINLAEMVSKLGKLERVLAPLAFTFGHKPVYRQILVELYSRYVPILVYKKSFAAKDEDKRSAESELLRLGRHGLKPLLDALADRGDPMQQRTAVAVLGHLGNRAAAPALVRVATTETAKTSPAGTLMGRGLDWTVRVDALVAAGRLGDPRTLPGLTELMNHREVAMREAATFALGMTGDVKAITPLTSALVDRRKSVRTLACLGLARIGSAKATASVIQVINDARNPDTTRAACAYAAGSIGDITALPSLLAALDEGNDETQRLAALALGKIGSPKATNELIAAYFSKRGAVRETVAWALAHSAAGRPAKLTTLAGFEYVPRYGKFDQQLAIESLGRLPSTRLTLPLAALAKREEAIAFGLRSGLARHRDLIVRILRDLDSRENGIGLGLLTAGIANVPPAEAKQIEAALGRIGASLGGELAGLTKHRDAEVRQLALSVVAKLGDRASRDALEAALTDRQLSVQIAATRASAYYFSQTKDAAIALPLSKMLASATSWQERLAACESLHSMVAAAPATTALRNSLKNDKKSIVRACSATGLGKSRSPVSEAALIYASESDHEAAPLVRMAAVRALSDFGTPAAQRAVEKSASSDPDPKVRSVASKPEVKK